MTNISKSQSKELTIRERLFRWFAQPLGQHLMQQEQRILEKIVPEYFGYHLLQFGLLHGDSLYKTARISHRFKAQIDEEGDVQKGAAMKCNADSLPIATDSVDVVLLPHVLEFSANPHKILREIERILIGEGHLIIVGFNPWSLFGLWRIVLAWREEPPWCGHFFSYHRIRDWFTLLDFELVRLERICYRPPIQNMNVMQKLDFLEKLGKYCWPLFGGIYIIEVQKRVIPLTPVKDIWTRRRSMIESGIVEPTTRSSSKME